MIAQSDPVAKRLQQLRGVGPIVATALVATVGNGEQFANGRQMAAALGLTPSSTVRAVKIGYWELVSVATLICEATDPWRASGDPNCQRKDDRIKPMGNAPCGKTPPECGGVALANKTARIAWAMLRHGTDYEPDMITAGGHAQQMAN